MICSRLLFSRSIRFPPRSDWHICRGHSIASITPFVLQHRFEQCDTQRRSFIPHRLEVSARISGGGGNDSGNDFNTKATHRRRLRSQSAANVTATAVPASIASALSAVLHAHTSSLSSASSSSSSTSSSSSSSSSLTERGVGSDVWGVVQAAHVMRWAEIAFGFGPSSSSDHSVVSIDAREVVAKLRLAQVKLDP